MADTALQRFKKDQQDQKEIKAEEGKIKSLDEFQASFLSALESIGEPKKPVKYLRPILESFKEDSKDTSLMRFALFLDPQLNFNVNYSINKKRKEDGLPPIRVTDLLESKDEKDYISGWDEIRKGVELGSFDLGTSVGTILFGGTDLALNTDFLSKFDEFMKDKEPTKPETWRGELTGLLVQFGVSGGLIQKIIGRFYCIRTR